MKNKEFCINCRSEINMPNWRIGKFRCRKCHGENIEIFEDELVSRVIKALEYKYKS